MTDNTQPEALRLAEKISDIRCQTEGEARAIAAAADSLYRQHARIAELEAELEAVGAGGVQALSAAPGAVSDTQHSQFLSDVLTAAGLITHGKQCKALGARLSDMVMRLRAAPQQEAQEPVAYIHVPHHTVEGQVRPVVSFEKYQQDYADGIYSTRIPLYTAPQPAPAPLSDDVVKDAARLDWLALAGPTSICVVIDRPHDSEVEVATDDVTGYGKTLREALDAAIAAQKDTP